MHSYTRQIGHYIGSTIAMSMLEEGAYNRLLDQHYNTERPLPADRAMLYRLARAQSAVERKAVDAVIARFFTPTEEGYMERNVMHDVASCRDKQIKASRSAEARRTRRMQKREQGAEASCKTDATGDANTDANLMQNACKTDAHQTPITNLQTPGTTPTPNPSRETGDAGEPLGGNGVVGARFEEGNASPPVPSLHQFAEAIRQRHASGTVQGRKN